MTLKITPRSLLRRRSHARRFTHYAVYGVLGLVAVGTLVGVLVVGNNPSARGALLAAMGIEATTVR